MSETYDVIVPGMGYREEDGAELSVKNVISLYAVGAIVLSRACPDDSPLADEILAVCRDAILASLRPSGTANAPVRRRRAG